MKEELTMLKSEIDEKSKTRKKNYSFCASGCGFVHCVESTEVGVLMYVCDTLTCNNCTMSLCVTDVWFCTWL